MRPVSTLPWQITGAGLSPSSRLLLLVYYLVLGHTNHCVSIFPEFTSTYFCLIGAAFRRSCRNLGLTAVTGNRLAYLRKNYRQRVGLAAPSRPVAAPARAWLIHFSAAGSLR